ncbi:MAG: Ig-like domain-containing protein [Bacteroidales bacterium]|nr:Ig-like domain-containing protein [Bacteroidales bacterium]
MKKIVFAAFCTVFALSTAVISCEEKVKLHGARLSPKEIIIPEDAPPQKLYLYLYPRNTTEPGVHWETSSDAVIAVSQDGTVSPVSPGTAYAMVYQGERALDSCKVTVNPVYHVESVDLDRNTVKMGLNSSRTLTVTITPENATYTGIEWTSTDNTVVTVNGGGMITAVGLGTSTVTATSVDGSHTDRCVVTVVGAPVNLLVNPGFEEPVELEAPFTTLLHQIGWTQITIGWVREFYESGNEKSGPKGIGPGSQTSVTNSIRASRHNGAVLSAANSVYFVTLGGLQGDCAARIGTAGGNQLGGFYQIVTVEPGETYTFGAIIGMRGNAAAQVIKDYEALKLLSPDGGEVYCEVIINPDIPEPGDVYERFNNQMAFIRNVKGIYTVPDGITQIRFQFDSRPFNGTLGQIPVTFVDGCFFEMYLEE